MIALGLGLALLSYSKRQNGGTGTKPTGDALSIFVHTRLGLGNKSFLARKTELAVFFGATIGGAWLPAACTRHCTAHV
jgi:hypothetical protein